MNKVSNENHKKILPNVRHLLKDQKGYFSPAQGAVIPVIQPTIKDLEIPRKFFHMSGSIIAWIYLFADLRYQTALLLLSIYAVAIFSTDIIRLLIPVFNQNYMNTFKKLMRKNEERTLNTSTFYILGALVAVAFFPKTVAVVSIFYLAFGDPIAAIVGMRFGRTIIFGKSLEGSMACFVVCFFVGLFFFTPPVAAFGALVATLSELLPIPLNDNFRIPILSAFGLMLVL